MSIPSFCAFGVKSGCAGAELWFKGEKDPCGRNRGTSWNNRAQVCAMRALRPSFSAASAPSVLFDAPRLCAELAPAVILPVQAIFLRKLQTAQIAVVLFEVRGQMFHAELRFQFLPDGVDAFGVLVGADGQGGGEPVEAVLGGVLCRPAHPQPRSGSASSPCTAE